jgi:AraC-like DNA-binding protein
MAVDVLQDVLSTVRLRTVTGGLRTLAAPWGFRTIPNDHHIAFLIIIDGGGLLELEEADPPVHQLQSGDIVVLPRGETYILRNKEHSSIGPFTELLARAHDASSTTTRLIGGCYQLTDSAKHPVFSVLPRIIHLRPQDYQPRQELDSLVHLFMAEAVQESTIQPVILNRLAEVLFMQMLRLFALQPQEGTSGWLRGLADPPIAAALQAIHANPAAPWTVELLAVSAHLSRSAFAERFREIVGEPPMQYVQRWRMQRAAHLLEAGNVPLKDIIALSGYSSEAAFRNAFHRWIGMLPSQYKEGIQRPGEKKRKAPGFERAELAP